MYPSTIQTKIEAVIRNARFRCYDPKHPKFPRYGARGITIYFPWIANPLLLLDHIGPPPSKTHSIDRIDNDQGYYPGNVRWATAAEQAANRRSTRKVQ